MKRLILLAIVILLCGCSPQRRLARLHERFPPDTTRTVEIVYRDTIIKVPIPGDTAYIETKIPVPYLDIDSISKLLGLNEDQKTIIDDLNKQLTSSFDVAPIYNETDLAKSKAWIEDGILKSELYQKDSILNIKLDSAIMENKTTDRIPYPVIVKAKPFYKNGFFILAGILLISLILIFAFRRK